MRPISRVNPFFVFGICLLLCCKKTEQQDQVPYVIVDIYMYAGQPSFSNLNAISGWAYINGGVKGIVVYRKSNNEFMAFDRNCTYQPLSSCATISVDSSSNIIAKDACCGSQFIITDGSVLKGPASFPLKQYQTSFDGVTLHIYN